MRIPGNVQRVIGVSEKLKRAASVFSNLRADCARCFGLCCIAPPFSVSADFAIDKDAGKACPNLQKNFRCGIHEGLRQHGFPGCTVYDCFGAGQKISQVTFAGRDWRRAPRTARQMFDVFFVVRQLHEILWYLGEALTLQPAGPLHRDIRLARGRIERLTRNSPDTLLAIDVDVHRQAVNELLLRTSALVRAEISRKKHDHKNADLIGATLRGADLRGANLRGAYLIAAGLSFADLRGADLIGADFRDCDIRGADLTGSIFLTQSQLNAAHGDADTKVPLSLTRPAHWSNSVAQSSEQVETS